MAAKAVVLGDLEDTVLQGKGWYVRYQLHYR